VTPFQMLRIGVIIFLGVLAGCSSRSADLAAATRQAGQTPEAALRAQLEPDAAVKARLSHSGVAASAFGRAVRTAVLNHPSVQSQDFRVTGARAAFDSASAAYAPRLSVGLDAGYSSYASGVSGNRVGPVISLKKLIYDGAAAKLTQSSRREGVALAQLDKIIQSNAIAKRAVETRIGVVRSRSLEKIAGENLAAHEKLIKQITSRVNAGAGSEADLLAGKSRLAKARARAIEASRARAQSEAAYFEAYGTAPPAGLTLPPTVPAELRRYKAGAVRRNAKLVRLDFAINQALFDLAALDAGRRPALVASLTAGPSVSSSGLSADVTGNLGVRIDLMNGGARAAKIKQAQANADDLKAQRAQAEREIVRALSYAKSDATAGAARVQAAGFALQAAQAALSTTKEQFGIGRRSITQVLDAQRDVSDAAVGAVNAGAGAVLNGYTTLGLTGDLLLLFGISPAAEAKGDGA